MKSPLRLLGVLLASALVALAAPTVEKTDVFISGQDGYHTYRIPAVIKAKNGTLLAFAEGRKSAGGDSGNIDTVLKRSTDGGRTWGSMQVVWDDADNTAGNPCPVLDETTGTIFLLSTRNLGTDHEKEIAARTSKESRTVWICRSSDHGATWSKPVEITSTTKDPSWTWYATGPGNGIQIKNGPYAGRLVIPCDHNYDDPEDPKKHVSGSHAIYSDDHGKTWKLSGTIRPKANECQVAELFDGKGTLLMNMRSNTGRNLRAISTSTDGGATWTAPVDSNLIEPVCQASLIRHETGAGKGLLVFSNPAAKARVQVTVKTSADDGKTWTSVAELHAGPSAYSSLVSLDAATVGCFYENGVEPPAGKKPNAYQRITFARVPLAP